MTTQLILIDRRKAEQPLVQAGCCEPDCGPETCAPATLEETVEQRVAQGGCCEPDCGPETCSCG